MTLAPVPGPTPFPHRPFARSEIEPLGLTAADLRNAVADGRLRHPFHGVYVSADLPDTQEMRTAALALVVSEHHVVCDRSAAWLHGVDTYAYVELEAMPAVETCAVRGHAPTAAVAPAATAETSPRMTSR